MLFFFRFQDREYRVRVEMKHGETYISFNGGGEEKVDLQFLGNDCSFVEDNEVFWANVTGQKTQYTVWRPEGNLEFTVESEYKRIVNILRGQDLGSENNIYAKMPGKIAKLFVKVGDTLEKSAPVLVMEAMKMENEIRAPLEGKVKQINIKEGQAVETGTLLVEMEPLE